MDNAANKRHVLHASNNYNIQQLKPTSTPDNQTICKQRRPQEPQVAAESNQNEASVTRRVAVAEQAQHCVVKDGENRPAATARPPVIVLRRCEDLHIRTSGFQKIEEDSQRRPMDLRRQHKLLEQQQQRMS